ncbi:MAG: aspartate-semialdehyde dehydrogenase [Candidatus Ratteibacteria bacterium]|nr:aspartate-semialdehyde dehydrogenase [Candidatus Ratteibacteria bacterium]
MNKKEKFNVAIAGATGVVGLEMAKVLQQRDFPVDKLIPLASERSSGKTVTFKGIQVPVRILDENSFKGVDIALFSAGAAVSKKIAPFAAKDGAIVIDNSSAWRMDPAIPLVVPEVNPEEAFKHKGIIANPNCSTIQMVVALKPIHDAAKIKRVVLSTYQSVSGWGKEAVEQLIEETKSIVSRDFKDYANTENVKKVLPAQIAFNVIPHIDAFQDNDYTKEEMKCVNETRKIMKEPELAITATCVRVPVFRCHSEAVNIQTEKKLSAQEAKDILSKAQGVKVIDNPASDTYPLAINADGKDEVFVGRIREDPSVKNGLNLWIVSDNLRKGAALNAVQIAELLIKQ